ncbi:hypothetical protein [Chitinophaga sp. YIM B06452]|uniref:hypothetical protein n=1 Tax=Chitinophaga sp. YIM B06452 TaxID=3082158 RepID=UPI0031FEE8B8
MKSIILSLTLFILIIPAFAQKQAFPENAGEILFDSLRDDPAFEVCNPRQVLEYYNLKSYYKSHKKQIVKFLLDNFHTQDEFLDQHGFLTVRFIINCNGQTGRFRLFGIDGNYQPIQFKPALSQQLLGLVKQLGGWQAPVYKEKAYDSYQYITFHIRNGKIISVSP